MTYIHDIDPIAFNIGNLAFPWYWLSYLAGFVWVLVMGTWLTKKYSSCLSVDNYWQQLQWGWPGLFIGARIFYVFFYNWDYFSKNPQMILKIWHGGMSFHGAVLGVLAFGWFIARRQKSSLWGYTDILATVTPMGIGLGRIANFINGELAGKVTGASWGVIFPRLYDQRPRHPSQLYEAFGEGFLLFALLLALAPRTLSRPGLQSSLFLIGYGIIRFVIEFYRLPDPQLGKIAGLNLGQYLCLAMVLMGGLILTKTLKSTSASTDKLS